MIENALFALATFFWCWKLEQSTLWLYAASVSATAIIKYLWRFV